MDEIVCERRLQHRIGKARGHFDEIAEHVVELDLQRIDAGGLSVAALHLGDDAAAVLAQAAHLIERLVPAGGNETAVSRKHGRGFDQRSRKFGSERAQAGQIAETENAGCGIQT